MREWETRQRQWLHNAVKALDATQLHTLKWFTGRDVNFPSKQNKSPQTPPNEKGPEIPGLKSGP